MSNIIDREADLEILLSLERAARELREQAIANGPGPTTEQWFHFADLLDLARAEIQWLQKDANRFRFLQNCHHVEAQTFFWNYHSRTQRAKAIDQARAAATEC